MLGIAPDRNGQLPQADVTRLAEFGAKLRQIYGNNLALQHAKHTSPESLALDGDINTFWPVPNTGAIPALTIEFPSPKMVDRTLIMERLNDGQHIEAYTIEFLVEGKWHEVNRAHAIGHMKIDLFPPTLVSAVRLRILSTTGPAGIREFQVFNGTHP